MFNKTVLLNPTEHALTQVLTTTNWDFAKQQILCPIVYSEMADAAREYPILFLKGKDGLFVLTGIEQGTNAYVADDGSWQATYLPAKLRSYPFALVQNPKKQDEYAIAIDAQAPQVSNTADGHPLFHQGVPSNFLKKRMELLEKMKKAEPLTQQMVKIIREAGILKDQSIKVQKPDQEATQLSGLEIIDEKALNQLPDDAFTALRNQGVLPLIYAHLLSLANLRQGAIAGKYPQMQQQKDDLMAQILKNETISFN